MFEFVYGSLVFVYVHKMFEFEYGFQPCLIHVTCIRIRITNDVCIGVRITGNRVRIAIRDLIAEVVLGYSGKYNDPLRFLKGLSQCSHMHVERPRGIKKFAVDKLRWQF